jgi:hypothetical protein
MLWLKLKVSLLERRPCKVCTFPPPLTRCTLELVSGNLRSSSSHSLRGFLSQPFSLHPPKSVSLPDSKSSATYQRIFARVLGGWEVESIRREEKRRRCDQNSTNKRGEKVFIITSGMKPRTRSWQHEERASTGREMARRRHRENEKKTVSVAALRRSRGCW